MSNVDVHIIHENEEFVVVLSFITPTMKVVYKIYEPQRHPKSFWQNWKDNLITYPGSLGDFLRMKDNSYLTFDEGNDKENTTLCVQLPRFLFAKPLADCIDIILANPKCWYENFTPEHYGFDHDPIPENRLPQ